MSRLPLPLALHSNYIGLGYCDRGKELSKVLDELGDFASRWYETKETSDRSKSFNLE